MCNRLHYQESYSEAQTVVQRLLDDDTDALDPRAELERIVPNRCPECGSSSVTEADDEGLIDCMNCGIWFDPLHPANAPNVPGNYPADSATWSREHLRGGGDAERERNKLGESLDDEIPDLKAYAMQKGLPPRIAISYSRTTPESAENGECSDSGWIEEEGVEMVPDQWDKEEGKTAVDLAVDFLWKNGATQHSSSDFDEGGWYTTGWQTKDYSTGEDEEQAYHLRDFTQEQLAEVYTKLMAKIAARRNTLTDYLNRQHP